MLVIFCVFSDLNEHHRETFLEEIPDAQIETNYSKEKKKFNQLPFPWQLLAIRRLTSWVFQIQNFLSVTSRVIFLWSITWALPYWTQEQNPFYSDCPGLLLYAILFISILCACFYLQIEQNVSACFTLNIHKPWGSFTKMSFLILLLLCFL